METGELNLCELLKGHDGEKFYSPIFGEVTLTRIDNSSSTILVRVGNMDWAFTEKGKFKTNGCDNGECMLFPSKEQRDWSKWIKYPKTWSQLVEQNKCEGYILGKGYGEVRFTDKGDIPVEKSALALLKIHRLIESGYGGNVTKEEWEDENIMGYYTIKYIGGKFKVIVSDCDSNLAFHTYEQAEEFISYEENKQLVKDFYMR